MRRSQQNSVGRILIAVDSNCEDTNMKGVEYVVFYGEAGNANR